MKESSLAKTSSAWLPDVDMIDCEVRQESLKFSGEPVMLQLPFSPCYVRALALQHVSSSVCLS